MLQLLDLTLQQLKQQQEVEQVQQEEDIPTPSKQKEDQTQQNDSSTSHDEKNLDDEFALFQVTCKVNFTIFWHQWLT